MSGSKLLEQAIVDAQALKEAAFMSAQAALIEKYAPEMKLAVQKLLEAEVRPEDEQDPATIPAPSDALTGNDMDVNSIPPDTDFGGTSESPMGAGITAGTASQLPYSATDGEKLCPCPDDDEAVEIELDLGQLAADLAAGEEDEEDALQSMGSGVEGQPSASMMSESSDEDSDDVTNVDLDEVLSLSDDEQEIDESLYNALKEASVKPVAKKIQENKTKTLINASSELLSEHKRLLKNVEAKDSQIKKLLGENKKYSTIIEEMSAAFVKLEEVNITNARLFYTNQVLKNTSLNERQKNNIVEAVSKADSVNAAKTVYETLISSVNGIVQGARPVKTLDESINKNSTFRMPPREPAKQPVDPMKNHWLKLAGIKQS